MLDVLISGGGMFSWAVMLLCAVFVGGSLLFIAGLQHGAKADDVGRALFAMIAHTVGGVFLTLGGLPAVAAMLSQAPLSLGASFALLFLFCTGGVLLLRYEIVLRSLPPAATAVPVALSQLLWRVVGLAAVLLGFLSLTLQLLLGVAPELSSWAMHVTAMLYGTLLLWLARSPAEPAHTALWRMVHVKKRRK
ncbi:MAG: hypothetical protein G01um101425_824 [Candidatus Peregrinibacteria bacterium Gr01-1014_25]|nr:MAG: hypothetical protein G01um101425_824 [Candidatus Peregrinibacteria bacterium Gr01-1014_25]